MKKSKYIIALSFLVIIYDCSNSSVINENPKQLTMNEIEKLTNIVQVTLDTIIIKINPDYAKETYSELPANMRNELQSKIIKDGFPLRADSAYYLGYRNAIGNLKKGNLVYKTYGLERLVEVNNNDIKWKRDEVYRYILLHKYAIIMDVIGGDLINPSVEAYKEGYEKIFIPVIKNFYGFDIFQKADDELIDVIRNEGLYHKEWIYVNNSPYAKTIISPVDSKTS